MPVAFIDLLPTVEFQGQGVFLEHTGVGSQSHGSPLGVDAPLRRHQVDNRVRAVRIELAGIGPVQATHVTSKLDHGHLHSEADAEERNMILPRVADRLNLSFATAIAESTWHQNSVRLTQKLRNSDFFNFFSLNAFQLHSHFVSDTAVNQSLEKALVRLLEAHVLADNRDFHSGFRCVKDLNDLLPLL